MNEEEDEGKVSTWLKAAFFTLLALVLAGIAFPYLLLAYAMATGK